MKIILTENQYKQLLKENIDFDVLYKQLYPTIYRNICLRYSNGDKETANDYCQLGFIKVYQKMDKFDGNGSIEGWVKRIVTNTIIDEIRKEKRTPRIKDIDFTKLDFSNDLPEEMLYSSSNITDAINTLSPMYQKVFKMFYFQDMTHQEIAEELEITEGTSKSNLFKAKAKIKSYLENLNKKI
jgi:RNA polymerase sigma-70 factor (ECF subfamily)